MNSTARILALPLLTAGILGGALGLAGTAAAATPAATHSTTGHGSHAPATPRDTRSHMPTQPRVFSPSIATSPKTHLHTQDAATYRHRRHGHFHRVW
ncbi:hypothetical protein [Mycobacterium kyogaense]|uniref:hypothetical protein n=1 Tax=Mycobacterium kyogaense TaxID=2212479 RepID=UPI0013C4B0A3|nr:hypothetical protein [Mycobacterium kyogaense]